MTQVDVSIIIVNYNTGILTSSCIESIKKFSMGFSYEVIVVDNGSNDEASVELAAREDINFINVGRNVGFGTANNIGGKHAKGEYYFLLNSDTLLLENSIKKLLDCYIRFEKEKKMGALGALLIDENQKIINSGSFFPTAKKYIKSYFGIVVDDFKPNYEQELVPIDFVTGADIFISKEKYQLINGFDENFFLYYEETDLQKRLKKQGWNSYICTSTRIIHLEGGSDLGGNRISNFKRMTIHKSRNRYLKKHDEFFAIYFILDMASNIVRIFDRKFSLKENINFVKENISSYFQKV